MNNTATDEHKVKEEEQCVSIHYKQSGMELCGILFRLEGENYNINTSHIQHGSANTLILGCRLLKRSLVVLDEEDYPFIRYNFYGVSVKLNSYTICCEIPPNYEECFLRQWQLQGSNDGINWFVLDIRADSYLGRETSCQVYRLSNNQEYYRQFQIVMYANSKQTRNFSVSAVEFFGDCISDRQFYSYEALPVPRPAKCPGTPVGNKGAPAIDRTPSKVAMLEGEELGTVVELTAPKGKIQREDGNLIDYHYSDVYDDGKCVKQFPRIGDTVVFRIGFDLKTKMPKAEGVKVWKKHVDEKINTPSRKATAQLATSSPQIQTPSRAEPVYKVDVSIHQNSQTKCFTPAGSAKPENSITPIQVQVNPKVTPVVPCYVISPQRTGVPVAAANEQQMGMYKYSPVVYHNINYPNSFPVFNGAYYMNQQNTNYLPVAPEQAPAALDTTQACTAQAAHNSETLNRAQAHNSLYDRRHGPISSPAKGVPVELGTQNGYKPFTTEWTGIHSWDSSHAHTDASPADSMGNVTLQTDEKELFPREDAHRHYLEELQDGDNCRRRLFDNINS